MYHYECFIYIFNSLLSFLLWFNTHLCILFLMNMKDYIFVRRLNWTGITPFPQTYNTISSLFICWFLFRTWQFKEYYMIFVNIFEWVFDQFQARSEIEQLNQTGTNPSSNEKAVPQNSPHIASSSQAQSESTPQHSSSDTSNKDSEGTDSQAYGNSKALWWLLYKPIPF